MKAVSAFLVAGLVPLGIFAAAQAETSERPKLEFDESGRGAVLCIAMIHIENKAYADTCKPEGGEEISGALDRALKDIAKFSAANSNKSEASYSAWIDHRYQNSVERTQKDKAAICSSKDAKEFYAGLEQAGVEGIKKATAHMLEIPRKPLMNPCL